MFRLKFNENEFEKSNNKELWFGKSEIDFKKNIQKICLSFVNKNSEIKIDKFDILDNELEKVSKDLEITIKNIKFNFFGTEIIGIFELFKKVTFENCIFNVNEIDIVTSYCFNKCIFENNKVIQLYIHKDVVSEEIVFMHSEFKNYIKINSIENIIKTEIFSEINVSLFYGCKIIGLEANYIKFNKYLFYEKEMRITSRQKNIVSGKLKLSNCEFIRSFVLDNSENILDSLILRESNFLKNAKVKIQLCQIKRMDLHNTKFQDLADFYKTQFIVSVDFGKTDFEMISVFSEVEFFCDVDFKYTKFLGRCIFRDAIIHKNCKLNLRDTIFADEVNFLDVSGHKRKKVGNIFVGEISDIKVRNRETARVIKNSFEHQNNIIEANRFYALEMRERTKEMKFFTKDNDNSSFEKFIFLFHKISSNHSQAWSLSLFWIFLITYFFSYLTVSNKISKQLRSEIPKFENELIMFFNNIDINILYLLIFIFIIISVCIIAINYHISKLLVPIYFLITIVYMFETKDYYLYNFSNLINPFSIMTKGEELTFLKLIYKVIIAYLIYQFIVSIRQNTRRK